MSVFTKQRVIIGALAATIIGGLIGYKTLNDDEGTNSAPSEPPKTAAEHLKETGNYPAIASTYNDAGSYFITTSPTLEQAQNSVILACAKTSTDTETCKSNMVSIEAQEEACVYHGEQPNAHDNTITYYNAIFKGEQKDKFFRVECLSNSEQGTKYPVGWCTRGFEFDCNY